MATNGYKVDHDVDSNDIVKKIVCLDDFEKLARKKLESGTFKFLKHGADEEITYRWNHQMIVDRFYLKPRILRDVTQVDTSKKLWGTKYSMPIGIAPTGMQQMFDRQGELATAKAASKFNAPMILSQFSTTSLEDIANCVSDNSSIIWQNIYMIKDKEQYFSTITRALVNGFGALVITCDAPVFGNRRQVISDQPDFCKYEVKVLNPKDGKIGDDIENHAKSIFDESRTWNDVSFIKKTFGDRLKIVVKGIMTAEDAKLAIEKGIDAIYVSNHGGRQLDGCSSTIEALEEIVKVVKKRVPVFVDGGFRTGSDVMKALALGADMIFLGRPILYGLSVGGQQGVEHALGIIHSELKRTMQLCGCTNLSNITKNLVSFR